ncbi:flavin monoamine oxidase family protein [Yinghuangia seranimata]|uniref:flavin monoamine oxidase family protein n=1 Tax=Yinghuangia seranimata TaxID=408067 RepID=UPI00248BD904|nr:NAD(P)/FAD-dependent oxidoreductase [Yinghuangia seranimata]MDI2128456.1 NAD(P)/FAD-dependent oxidoreductase [Yinghuangia seranimata]
MRLDPAAPLRVTTKLGTPNAFRALVSAHLAAKRRGMPVADLLGEMEGSALRRAELAAESAPAPKRQLNRRQLLGAAGAFAAASALPGGLLAPTRANAATAPRVVIVGGGLAGLRCAHKLWTDHANVAATVYDADTSHAGGRCWSLRGFFNNGAVSEHGGAFVSSADSAMLGLARRFGVHTELANGGELKTGDYTQLVNGQQYPGFDADVNALMPRLQASVTAMGGSEPRYNSYNAEAQRLDNMSMLDYFTEIGVDERSPLGEIFGTIQRQGGGEPRDSSAVGFISFWAGGGFSVKAFDELYHLEGGNDQVITGMLSELPQGTLKQGYELVALRRNTDSSYTCTFKNGSSLVQVAADHVILALPFRQLREVDFSAAGFSARKSQAICQQGMGHNAKLVVQLNQKTWPSLNRNGIVNTDRYGFGTAWDGSVNLGTGGPALLVNFPGGDVARYTYTGAAHGPAPTADVNFFLNGIETVFPGTRAAFNGKAYEDHWSVDPWHYGAYHYYKVGQYTAFAGYEGVQEGRVHFAGEHTDVDNATLNAAVASGERCADEVLAQI